MKLHILSDLHLDLTNTFQPKPVDADVIILAGDIGNGIEGITLARECWPDQEIIYVPGNHEFYGHDRVPMLAEMRKIAKQHGVCLLDGQADDRVVNLNSECIIVGCTLWTDFLLYGESQKTNAMNKGYMCLNDFRRIKDNGVTFTPERSAELHEEALAWLKKQLDFDYVKAGWKKMIVVTHHLPSLQSVAPKYKGDLLTACFASALDELVGKADWWIHGHSHSSADYMIEKARVISNPRGYERYGSIENKEFNPGLVIEI